MTLVVCCALTLLSAPARAGVTPPEWCRARGSYPLRFQTLSDALDSDEAQRAIPALVAALCQPDEEGSRRAGELEIARRRWSQRLDLAYEDWADAAAWATMPPAARHAPALRTEGTRAWSSLEPVEQYLWISSAQAERGDPAYLADALGPRLSESGRLAYLEACLGDRAGMIEQAACQLDTLAFDPHKVSLEVHADQRHDGYTRFVIRLAAFTLATRVADPTRRGAGAASVDPVREKMLAIATSTQRSWARRAAQDAPLLALTAAMEDARALQPFQPPAGCDQRTWPAWQAAIAALPARQLADLRQRRARPSLESALELVLADPTAYLAGVAHHLCRSLDRPDALERSLGEVLRRAPAQRGPRTATLAAIAAAKLSPGNRGATFERPAVSHEWLKSVEREAPRSDAAVAIASPTEGTIATLKRGEDSVEISFATRQGREPRCAQRGAVNHLTQVVSPDGLVDERTCLKEELVSVSRRPPTRTVRRRYATGLKPGMEVWLEGEVVALAWPRAGAPVPAMVAGCSLRGGAKERSSR